MFTFAVENQKVMGCKGAVAPNNFQWNICRVFDSEILFLSEDLFSAAKRHRKLLCTKVVSIEFRYDFLNGL